jgi:hypothetical protein
MNYKLQLIKFYKRELGRHEVFDLGNTPPLLLKHGFTQSKIYMTKSTMVKCTRKPEPKKTGHDISRNVMKYLEKHIANPILIIKKEKEDSFVLVTDRNDKECRPIVIGIEKNGNNNLYEIKSVFGRSDFEAYIAREKEKGNVLYEDKKRAEKLCRSVRQQYQEATTAHDSNNTIP